MRSPWLVSAAAAALLVTLAGFAPPSAGEVPCAGGGPAALDSPAGGPPPDPCQEHYAHASGYLAYLQARLQLTADQQPLWDKWQQKLQAAAMAEQHDCQADRAKLGSKPNALQREDDFVRSASARIDSIKASRPALEALYGALTPAQQEVFDRLWPPMPPHPPRPPKLGELRGDMQPPGGQGLGGQAPGGQAAGGGQPALPEP